jgi:hypothetical protein
MRIAQEMLSVVVDSNTDEICIVLAGLRIALTPDETARVTNALLVSLERLTTKSAECCDHKEATGISGLVVGSLSDGPGSSSGHGSQPPPPDDGGEPHDKRRALIRAKIRIKGLSLGDKCPS